MRVMVEMSLNSHDSIGMESNKVRETLELSIEEWVGGNSKFREGYVRVNTIGGKHLFDIRIGSKKQVYVELPNSDIITVRGEQ